MTVYIRTTASPEALEEPVRREIQAVNPDLPVFGVRALRSIISDSLASRRFAMQILGLFATTAMLLAAIGIYGVMAYFVSQRVREIGVRMALGAQRADVMKLIVWKGMSLALVGVTAGLVAALVLTRLISGLLFGVSATDPLTLAAFTMLLGLSGISGKLHSRQPRGEGRSHGRAAIRMNRRTQGTCGFSSASCRSMIDAGTAGNPCRGLPIVMAQ